MLFANALQHHSNIKARRTPPLRDMRTFVTRMQVTVRWPRGRDIQVMCPAARCVGFWGLCFARVLEFFRRVLRLFGFGNAMLEFEFGLVLALRVWDSTPTRTVRRHAGSWLQNRVDE